MDSPKRERTDQEGDPRTGWSTDDRWLAGAGRWATAIILAAVLVAIGVGLYEELSGIIRVVIFVGPD